MKHLLTIQWQSVEVDVLYIQKDRPTCDDIYDSAVDSHTDCYLKCGFCEICKTEKWALFKGYHVTDFFSVKSLKTVFRVLRACGPLSCLL